MLDEIIKNRRSVRIFDGRPVEKKIVEEVIEAGTFAPSACNAQGWKFIVVDKQDIKDEIFNLGGSINIKTAPLGILVIYDNRSKNTEYRDYIQSAAAAIENMLLKAHSLGLGGCWTCHLPSSGDLRRLFGIPSFFSPVAYVLLGYPKNQPQPTPRKYTLSEVMNYNTFSREWPAQKIGIFKLATQRVAVRLYRLMPKFVKRSFFNKFLDENFVKKFKN